MHVIRSISRWTMVAILLVTTFGQIATLSAPGALASSATQADEQEAYPAPTQDPTFKEARCPFAKSDIPADIADRGDLTCGTVEVPEDHAKPDGKTIKVFVTKIPSISKDPFASPLFVLAGGPGQGASIQLAQFSDGVQDPIASWQPFVKDHDVYLVDQRGTGYSDPVLTCPADVATPAGDSATPTADDQTAVGVYGDCAQALTDEGIDVSTFTTRQSAADLDLVRQAIGAEQVDLLGTSYGTWLALEMMRDYPDSVRSSVLNSPVPPQTDLFAGQLIAFQDSLDAVYAGCKDDKQCNAAYPNLEKLLTDTVSDLNKNPMTISYTDPNTNKKDRGDVDGSTLMSLIYQLVFVGPYVPFVAPLVGSVADGDDSILSQLVPILLTSGEGISTGLYYAVMCQDEIPFSSVKKIEDEAAKADVSQDVIDEGLSSSEGTFDICKAWDLDPSPEIENTAVTSDIPTLIVTGKFDPITPSSYGKELLKTLSNGQMIVSPIAGHDPASTTGTCGVGIIHRFLNNPEQKDLKTSCLDDLSLDFSPS